MELIPIKNNPNFFVKEIKTPYNSGFRHSIDKELMHGGKHKLLRRIPIEGPWGFTFKSEITFYKTGAVVKEDSGISGAYITYFYDNNGVELLVLKDWDVDEQVNRVRHLGSHDLIVGQNELSVTKTQDGNITKSSFSYKDLQDKAKQKEYKEFNL